MWILWVFSHHKNHEGPNGVPNHQWLKIQRLILSGETSNVEKKSHRNKRGRWTHFWRVFFKWVPIKTTQRFEVHMWTLYPVGIWNCFFESTFLDTKHHLGPWDMVMCDAWPAWPPKSTRAAWWKKCGGKKGGESAVEKQNLGITLSPIIITVHWKNGWPPFKKQETFPLNHDFWDQE